MNHKAGDVVLTKFGKGQIIYINPDGRLAEVRYPSRTSCLTRYYHIEDLQRAASGLEAILNARRKLLLGS